MFINIILYVYITRYFLILYMYITHSTLQIKIFYYE